MENDKRIEQRMLSIQEKEEDIIWIKGQPFLVQRATPDDVDRVNKGMIFD
ncbi:hypothetical protein ACP26L_25725 [Paenibacillus sp. S-38]